MNDAAHRMHLGVAEAGKLLALKGRHEQALERYREALRLAHGAKAPQLFARHYLHCVLESLEHMGDHLRAAQLAGAAAEASANPDPTPFQQRDRAHLLERQGVNLVRAGDVPAGRVALEMALVLDAGLGVARDVLAWTARGLTVSPARLADAQRRHGYWMVRADSVTPDRAMAMPVAELALAHEETVHGG
jgi:tetratricopeptide (TPR) repeat protein